MSNPKAMEEEARKNATEGEAKAAITGQCDCCEVDINVFQLAMKTLAGRQAGHGDCKAQSREDLLDKLADLERELQELKRVKAAQARVMRKLIADNKALASLNEREIQAWKEGTGRCENKVRELLIRAEESRNKFSRAVEEVLDAFED